MADGESEYKIRIDADSTGAVAGASGAAQGMGHLGGSMADAQAIAERTGKSLELVQAAIAKNAAMAKAIEVEALARALRDEAAAAEQAAGAGEEAAASAEDQAEATRLLQESLNAHQQTLMRNVFYVHRLAEGFKDISMGGRLAGQGLMDVSEALQYMLAPEYAIYVVIAQVVGMLAVMATMHRRRGEEAKNAAEAEAQAAKTSSDAFSRQVSEYQAGTSAMIQAQSDRLKAEQASTEEISKQGEMMKAQAELDKQAALLKLQETYTELSALANPEQKARLDRSYNAAKADIEGATTVHLANLDAMDAAAKAKEAKDKLAEQEQNLAKNTKALADARAQQVEASFILAKYGVVEGKNEKGEPTGALTSPATGVTGVPFTGQAASADVLADLKEKITDGLLSVASLRQPTHFDFPLLDQSGKALPNTGYSGAHQQEVEDLRKARLAQAESQLQANQQQLADLQKAQAMIAQSQAVLGDKDLQKSVKDAPAAMFQANIDAQNAATAAEQAAQKAQQAQQADDLAARQRKIDDDHANALQKQETILKGITDKLEAQKTLLETQRDAPTTTPQAKADVDVKIGQLDNQLRDTRAQFENWKAGHGAPLPSPSEQAPQNPYDAQLLAMRKLADSLQNTIDTTTDGHLQAAQAMLDTLNGVSRINGQIVKSNRPIPGTIPYVEGQAQSWQNANAQAAPPPTPDQQARQASEALQAAQDAQTTSQAAQKARDDLSKAHADMGKSIKDMADTTGRVVDIVGALATQTKEAHDRLAGRVDDLDQKVKAARNNHQS